MQNNLVKLSYSFKNYNSLSFNGFVVNTTIINYLDVGAVVNCNDVVGHGAEAAGGDVLNHLGARGCRRPRGRTRPRGRRLRCSAVGGLRPASGGAIFGLF